MNTASQDGIVYTETVVHAPPAQFAADAPYQLALIDLDSGERKTVRIEAQEPSQRVTIGCRVVFVEEKDQVAYYRKAEAP